MRTLVAGYPNNTAAVDFWDDGREDYEFGDAVFDDELGISGRCMEDDEPM